jgi:GTP cyclohydrolase I
MLPDHASQRDDRQLAIDQVGISRLRYPITVWDRANQKQHTVADIALSVGLPAHFKGTHMSRFIEVLEQHRGELSLKTVPALLEHIQRRLEAEDAYIDVRFPYFLERSAPVSGATSLMEYACRFKANRKGDQLDFALCVTVPVTTLCPCSKAVSEYGAHNQRGLVDVELRFDDMVWIEQVVEAVEAQASSPLYALLKREDEKFVTEAAYDNPRFVEDLVRDCVLALRELPGVSQVTVQVENLESIHNHSAWGRLTWRR